MPNEPYSSFDSDATLEELAGIGKNRRFDAKMDDDAYEEIQVIYKRGNEEIPLAKPSRAVYFGDRVVYNQEAARFSQAERDAILNTDQFPRNIQVFNLLKRTCNQGLAIPFIGAGMSVSAGCPGWRSYLLKLAAEAGLDIPNVTERLDKNSDYEGVMEDIIEKLTEARFERDFQQDFDNIDLTGSAVALLPHLFKKCAVTTNFDRVAEEAWRVAQAPFTEKVFGRGNPSAFYKAVASGDHYLLKLHGNLDSAAERVLRKTEYDDAYGNDDNIHFDRPVPKLLKRLFMSYSFVFLGCSLSADRTIQTFMKVAQDEGGNNLPHHFAILARPDDEAERLPLEQRLADAHITPLWYPDGDYNSVALILELLRD